MSRFQILPEERTNRVRLRVDVEPDRLVDQRRELTDQILTEIHKSAWVTRRTKVKIIRVGGEWDVEVTCGIVKELDRAPVKVAITARLKARGMTERF